MRSNPIIPTPSIIRDSRVIELFVEYTFKGRKNSNFEYSDEKIGKIRLKCKRLVLMKNCCLLFLACCSQNQENLKELAKIRKFHFSCQKVWRNKHATENYFENSWTFVLIKTLLVYLSRVLLSYSQRRKKSHKNSNIKMSREFKVANCWKERRINLKCHK